MIEIIRIASKKIVPLEDYPLSSTGDHSLYSGLLDLLEDIRMDEAFAPLNPESPEEQELDYRLHVYGIDVLSCRDEQKYHEKLNKPGYRYGHKRNRRYSYRPR